MSVNKVILLGNVGQEPDVRTFDGGATIAGVSLATTEKGYTLQNGTQVPDRTDWHRLVFRGRLAEVVKQYVHKGDKLYIEGKLRVRNYEDKGQKHTVIEVFVDSMEMLTPKPTQQAAQPTQAAPSVSMFDGGGKSDLPF